MTDDAARIDSELEITHAASATRARIAPNRGGMATGFDVAGRAIFFMDRESFVDASKNVRGGAPVLFPTPGKLAGDTWSRGGKTGVLKQHGFARNLPWTLVRRAEDALTLRLTSDASTRASYPWDFVVELTYRVTDGTLHADAHIENGSSDAMPFGFGFHPYFLVQDKGTFELDTSATRAFDNVTKREVHFDRRALDLRGPEIDLHLLDHPSGTMAFDYDLTSRVTILAASAPPAVIEGSPSYAHWVLWSVPGRDFVCVEPWTCPGDAMNTGSRLAYLAPGESVDLALSYVVTRR